MDIDLFLFCCECSNYVLLKEFLLEYLKDALQEKIVYKKYYINSDDYTEYIGCSLFSMSIESKFTSKECFSEFTLDEYDVSTNVLIYVNLYTDTMINAIHLLKKLINELEKLFHTNIIVEDHTSTVVYISSANRQYIKNEFWTPYEL